MISSLGFVPNSEARTALSPFVPDAAIKEKLDYLQIPLVDISTREAGEEEESDEAIEATDSILYYTSNTEQDSIVGFNVYNAEDNFLHHDVYVFSTILDSTHVRDGLVAVATYESDVMVYDAFTRFPILPQALLSGHSGCVTGIAQHGGRLASSGDDGRVIEWDLEKLVYKEDLNRLFINRGEVPGAPLGSPTKDYFAIERFDFDGSTVAAGAQDVLNINGNTIALDASLERIRIHGGLVYVVDDAGQVLVYDPRCLSTAVRTVDAHSDDLFDIAFHEGKIATCAMDGSIKVWDGQFNELHSVKRDAPVFCVAFDKDGRLFAGDDEDAVAEIEFK
ncbi:hypothetical protein PAPHI01_1951 [Pancytospora philotis]|nr:hypothetical protein PAPHI01_1951 [Pancytospora philotis]